MAGTPYRGQGPFDFGGVKLTSVGDPTSATDAANKEYVDSVAAGLDIKQSVIAATTANITLSGTQTIDTVAVTAGQRVLVKNQTTASGNGIYAVAAGAWARTSDAIQGTLTSGALVTVESGSANGSKSFVLTTPDPITVGTTSLTWSPFSAGTSYLAGNGLSLTGTTFAVVPGAGILADGTSTRIDPSYSGLAKRFAENVPSGSTTATINHNLGTTDVLVGVFDIAAKLWVLCDITYTDANNIVLGFNATITSGQYRVIVLA